MVQYSAVVFVAWMYSTAIYIFRNVGLMMVLFRLKYVVKTE